VVHRQHVTSLIIEVTRLMTKPPTQLDLEDWAGSTQYSMPIGSGRGSRSSEHWAPEQQQLITHIKQTEPVGQAARLNGGFNTETNQSVCSVPRTPPFTYIQL